MRDSPFVTASTAQKDLAVSTRVAGETPASLGALDPIIEADLVTESMAALISSPLMIFRATLSRMFLSALPFMPIIASRSLSSQ